MMNAGGRILALDVGKKRIGVAVSDELSMIARPHSVVVRNKHAIPKILSLVMDLGVRKIVIGLPLHLDGREGEQAEDVRTFVKKLEPQVSVEVVLWDERLSTVEAEERMSVRKSGKHKLGVDAVAAAVILESYLSR